MNNHPLTVDMFDKRLAHERLATNESFEKLIRHMDERFVTKDVFEKFIHHFDKRMDGLIDELALATANGFHEMDERFNEVNKELRDVKHSVAYLTQSTTVESASNRVRLLNLEARVA